MSSLIGRLAPIGGIHKEGLFGGLHRWIDSAKPPGTTSQTTELGFRSSMRQIVTLRYFFLSPNLVWLTMAVCMHLLFPYRIEAALEWNVAWAGHRLALNFTVCYSYYALFWVGLYSRGWAARKYVPGSFPTAGNMAHNLYYWGLGVLQWTAWECVLMRLWATGKVPYAADAEVLARPGLLAWNVFWVMLVPIWRDLHFYIAHRFIHIRAIYRFVHSLHHRNADPEPFSGMTMHPVEHLYYFSNALVPCLYVPGLSPLIFLWLYVHLTIAPGAGHSGWEDHFQADQYHYLHHAKFECNYGSPMSGFIDQWCGTFREKLGHSTQYSGEYADASPPQQGSAAATDKKSDAPAKPRVWSKDSYLGLPADRLHGAYTLFWVGLWPLAYWGAVTNHGAARVHAVAGLPVPALLAAVVAYGPVALALLLCWLGGDRASWRWPFQKERLVGQFGIFAVLGWLACMLPVYHSTKWVCEA